MSESRFDNAVQAAWGNFETRLSVSLEALGDGSMVIDVEAETSGEGSAPYIQVAGDGCLVRGEVSGNRFLDRACRLDAVQRRGLVALGWKRPDDQHPNWWVELERDRLEVLQTMVLGALRQVLGVMHPKFLGWDDPGDAGQTVAAARCEVGFPTTREELRAMVKATVADHLGTSEVTTDADGDIPHRFVGIRLRIGDEHLHPIGAQLPDDVYHLGVSKVGTILLERQTQDSDLGALDVTPRGNHLLDSLLGDELPHPIVDPTTGRDDLGVIAQRIGLVRQVVGIDADAVPADQARRERQEVPLRRRRRQDVRGPDGEAVADQPPGFEAHAIARHADGGERRHDLAGSLFCGRS